MGTTDRSLSVLKLFSLDRPIWTVEEVVAELGVSISTAYRYVLSLEDAGLVTTSSPGKYILGPAIIQLDRQIQITDPLLCHARPVMEKIATYAPEGSVVLLCRVFGDSVLCMHQVYTQGPQSPVSYERGRPMPLFRGATSSIILAHQPARILKKLYAAHEKEIAQSGFGRDWQAFRDAMAKLRKAGFAVSYGAVDWGRIGIGAPLLSEERAVGSLSYVIADTGDSTIVALLSSVAQAAAREIEAAMQAEIARGALPS
jgi:DNA-binding IclR family transcriptional regulator